MATPLPLTADGWRADEPICQMAVPRGILIMKNIVDEGLRNPAIGAEGTAISKEFREKALKFVISKIDAHLDTFTDKFPAPASVGNVYPAIDNIEWTSSFWTGMLWLAYEVTGNEKYRLAAERQLETYRERLKRKELLQTHDLGFLYTLSCVAAWKLTGDAEARTAALAAADALMLRYFDKAGIIQAWGNMNDPQERGRMIIDCCMNLPLLFWASEQSSDARYREAAISHARMAARHIVREDASTYHTFFMDLDTGAPRYGKTSQGYSDSSCWARGQAWGMYGFALAYRYTGDTEFIDLTKKISHYFLNRLPADHICYWDLIFTKGDEPRDTSAAAIAACGLLETAGHLDARDLLRPAYRNAALHIIESLAKNNTTADIPESSGLLLHAVYSKPGNCGVDECCIWGDYFYFEALVRIAREWKSYW
jgi:unsaturated chondroitin disaccharide hydrolase